MAAFSAVESESFVSREARRFSNVSRYLSRISLVLMTVALVYRDSSNLDVPVFRLDVLLVLEPHIHTECPARHRTNMPVERHCTEHKRVSVTKDIVRVLMMYLPLIFAAGKRGRLARFACVCSDISFGSK